MKIPDSGRKKALILVDVQPGFLRARNSHILPQIQKLLEKVSYDLYVSCIFHAEKGSIWDIQTHWTLPKDKDFKVDDSIERLLGDKKILRIEKNAKSAFKGDVNLLLALRNSLIQEVHLVGLDANDCVLATAYEAFDFGYFTYVIEECTESSDSESMRDTGFAALRHVNLTNHSCIEKINFLTL